MWVIYWDDKQLQLDTVEKVMIAVDTFNKVFFRRYYPVDRHRLRKWNMVVKKRGKS